MEGEFVGLDFREVEDVAEQFGEMAPRGVERVDIASLLLIERGLQQQLGEPYNAVHWGADFVTHAGQKRTLAPVGLLGPLLALFQRLGSIVDMVLKVLLVVLKLLGVVVDGGQHGLDGL